MDQKSNLPRRVLLQRLAAAGACGLGGALLPGISRAQARSVNGWPSQPVRVVVPVPAGSQTDIFARFVTDHLAKAFGHPFVVDNKPGGTGRIGTQQVLRAAADGQTLLFSAASFTVVPQALNTNLPYDVLKDLAPIAQIGAGGNFLAVGNEFPAKSVRELVDMARASPDKLTYGTTGVGSVTHILMASLLKQQGVRMAHVPYKSGAEVVRDMIGGVLPVGWVDTTNGGVAGRTGKIRLLGVSGTYRVPGNLDVATLAEQGFGLDQNGWFGLYGPAGTPEPVLRAINSEVNKLMVGEEARQRLALMNLAAFPANTPEQFTQTMRNDLLAWRKIVVDNDIKVE
jgi:tripartite-type tricarboxylate transporter receptor subunit TctC